MKASLLFKFFIILPLLLFVDYLLMVLLGCASCLFGTGDHYYCGTYCVLGKVILGLSALAFLALLIPDIRQALRKRKTGQ